jgi:BTB/POZ domain-containing protein KCTD9
MRRPSYVDSIALLKDRIDILGEALPSVSRRPRHDDAEMGPSIFRTGVEDVSLEGLTLTGLYVGRSELVRISFKATDLRLSAFNWSDFIDCDFSGADLSDVDLRACIFTRCSFAHANLTGSDLRGSTFDDCTFSGADLRRALVQRRWKLFGLMQTADTEGGLQLDAEQRRGLQWSDDAPEPGGG